MLFLSRSHGDWIERLVMLLTLLHDPPEIFRQKTKSPGFHIAPRKVSEEAEEEEREEDEILEVRKTNGDGTHSRLA